MRTLTVLLATAALAIAADPQFREHVIATDLKGGYHVVAIDMNHDGKIDLIALASGMKELVWYENPNWERHVITGNLNHMINVAAWDTDGDGIPELVLATEFANVAKNSIGIVSVLHHNGDPREPWTIQEIDRLTTTHRLRFADIDGSGKKVCINAPLTGAKADAPDYRDHAPLVFYRPGVWKPETISDANEGVQHGIYINDWRGDGRDSILTASFSGIHRNWLDKNGRWQRAEISKGSPDPWPKGGSSDVTVGHLGKHRFLAAIEPWHGNIVSVYNEGKKDEFTRGVIDTKLVDGHTIITADLDGNKHDAIIAGYRGTGRSVYIYRADDAKGTKWSRTTLDDGGIGAAACAAADFNSDGRIDIACIGSATTNLKWYENLGAKKR